ncbi:66 kDa stress protein [Smittium culicis]|uniref:66 kDa stress protein n=1 Tax=Smittium culicis TaxID=133412 RepID=A0A1R1XF54_9FUNG|nr:66 kDa stress protein [Smittium culicis]OMJ13267.1 66 kDa stress protein [Smittium culicis]
MYDLRVLKTVKLDGAPKNIAIISGSNSVVSCLSNSTIVSVTNSGKVIDFDIKGTPTFIAAHPSLDEIAVGFEDSTVKIFSVSGLEPSSEITDISDLEKVKISGTNVKLLEKCTISIHNRAITCLSYSPNGKLLASGDQSGKIYISDSSTGETLIKNFVSHTAMIKSLSWFPNSTQLVSGSLDSNIIVWDISKPLDSKVLKLAHLGGVSSVAAINDTEFFSCGLDSVIKKFQLV